MKVGDLVKTTRYGTYYLVLGKCKDLSSSWGGQVFNIISIDFALKQVLNERYLELVK